MQLSGLERFIEIAEAGSYYQAQKAGGEISAQAYSKVVSSLEQELGVRLVKASRRGIELTPEGSVFLEFARSTLDSYTQLQTRFRNAHISARSKPPVVYTTFYAASVISELISQELIPGDIQMCEDSFEGILNRTPSLRENEMALIDLQEGSGSGVLRDSGLSFKSFAECQPMVVVSKDSALASLGRSLEISDLWGARIICNSHPEMQHKHRRILSALPRETEVSRFSSIRGIWEYLRMNPGCVFLADSVQGALMPDARQIDGEGFVFVPIATNYPPAKLGVLRSGRQKKSLEVAELTHTLSEVLAKLSHEPSASLS